MPKEYTTHYTVHCLNVHRQFWCLRRSCFPIFWYNAEGNEWPRPQNMTVFAIPQQLTTNALIILLQRELYVHECNATPEVTRLQKPRHLLHQLIENCWPSLYRAKCLLLVTHLPTCHHTLQLGTAAFACKPAWIFVSFWCNVISTLHIHLVKSTSKGLATPSHA